MVGLEVLVIAVLLPVRVSVTCMAPAAVRLGVPKLAVKPAGSPVT